LFKSNEETKAANEEMKATNEETKAASEEAKAANERMKATNEEKKAARKRLKVVYDMAIILALAVLVTIVSIRYVNPVIFIHCCDP